MGRHYRLEKSADALCAGLPKEALLSPALAVTALTNSGFLAGLVERPAERISEYLLPVILLRQDKEACVLTARHAQRGDISYDIIFPELGDEQVRVSAADLKALGCRFAVLVKPRMAVDERAGAPFTASPGHWLWSTLWRYSPYYTSAAMGALLINILTLASVFFTMNVYDRVVPNQALVTLWSLAVGVVIAMAFETITRAVRSHLLDLAGKKADLVMGVLLFRQALSVQMEHKPASAGAFANQLREFESVRDFVTSATLSTLSDLPFVFLFISVIFVVGGPLGWVPLLMVPVIVGVSVVIQWPLARTMQENLRELSLKQGVLIESVEGLETLKANRAEGYMQGRWERYSALAASSAMKARHLSSLLINFTTFIQQIQTVVLIVLGVYLIQDGSLTQGALIASVMLASRATSPLNQVAGLAVRFQQAKAGLNSLNRLMQMPVDRDPQRHYLPNPPLSGDIGLREVSFAYPAAPMQPNPTVLHQVSLQVRPGERLAILGRIGSGKSTLLRLMARLYLPVSGQVTSDGIDATQIDPADWRRAVGYVGQDARLFYGSLRQNVMIGCPDASIEELLHVLRLVGLDTLISRHPQGINLPIGEMGEGLSGGQRQLVALARCLLAQPKILLLDEPTSAMDSQTETMFMTHLLRASAGQAIVLVTHRPSLLTMVERLVVVDDGRIVADGPKQQVLAALAANSVVRPVNVA